MAFVSVFGEVLTSCIDIIQHESDLTIQVVKRMERDKTSINSPLFRFFDRETIIAEELLYTVLNDLSDIQGVCGETVKPTNRLRLVMKSLSKGTIPKAEWAKFVNACVSV